MIAEKAGGSVEAGGAGDAAGGDDACGNEASDKTKMAMQH
jgi:hypothetical protein